MTSASWRVLDLHYTSPWRSFRRPLATALLAVTWLAGLPAGQVPFRFAKGQSVFVVALRTTGGDAVFRPCQVGGETVVSRPRPGMELVPGGIELLPGGMPDEPLRRQVETLFRKRGRFVVADDAGRADIVFVVQVQGGASFSGLQVSAGPRRPAPLTFGVGALDTPAGTTTPVRLLAVAVRGAVWRGGARDATSLLQGRVWDGTEHAVGSQAVSPDALVEAFSKHPDRPYPPSRQAGRPPMFDELPPEPGSTLNDQQPPRQTYRPFIPHNPNAKPQPVVCAAPLAPRAAAVAPAVPAVADGPAAVAVSLLVH